MGLLVYTGIDIAVESLVGLNLILVTVVSY